MAEKIIDLIRKLNAHAESAASIGNMAEAEAFAAKVQDLLQQHKLDMAEVEQATLDLEDPMQRRTVQSDDYDRPRKRRRENWTEQLGHVVAAYHFCSMAVVQASNDLLFYGRQSDIQVAMFIFVYLARIAGRLGREEMVRIKSTEYRKVKRRDPRSKKQWRHRTTNRLWPGDHRFLSSFHDGFRYAIWERYRRQRAVADTDANTALILRKSTDEAKAFADKSCRPANQLKKNRTHEDAAARGWERGHEVDLNRRGLHGRTPQGLLS